MTPRHQANAALAMALGGLLLLAVHPVSRFYPACPIYEHFHLLCPGCGATRALAALLHGNLATAWRMNPLFVCATPCLAWYAARSFRTQSFPWPRLSSPAFGLFAAVTLLLTVARNL